jgi:hypothetical protein
LINQPITVNNLSSRSYDQSIGKTEIRTSREPLEQAHAKSQTDISHMWKHPHMRNENICKLYDAKVHCSLTRKLPVHDEKSQGSLVAGSRVHHQPAQGMNCGGAIL